nr:MAG TPA: hypothetical protein [Caudoviricetes sp.]DAW01524.1 MAG TPA: hypothetical protein [Caudoviricetes sp.]
MSDCTGAFLLSEDIKLRETPRKTETERHSIN